MTATGNERTRFLTDAGEPSAFVIVTSARSGSNLLVTYLRQVTQLACFGEILRERFPETSGWDKLVRRLDLPADARRLHAEAPTEFWGLFLAHGLRRRRYLGAKAFYYHRRGDRLWDRFGEPDHRVLHLWRDATFDQYVSRLLALASGEWKAGDGADEPQVTFERDGYLRYREAMRRDIEWARVRYGGTDRYVELEYRQLAEHAFVEELMLRLFGERVDVREGLRRQRPRPKIEYLTNPAEAEPFAADSISAGFAPG
jgi:LPS sulfotransferase NodH